MSDNNSRDVIRVYGFPDNRFRVRGMQGVFVARDDDDGDRFRGRPRLEFTEDGPPVHLREHQIEQHEIRPVVLDDAQGGEAVGGAHHREPVHRQRHAVKLGERRIVFDDENTGTSGQVTLV